MVNNLIKIIVTFFLLIISIVLACLWILFGTLLLIALLIRLITLYTISLLNTSVSGNPMTHDYTKAIEDVIHMYIQTFVKIFAMPKLPWLPIEDKENVSFRALLPHEIKELKKSWYITIIVFLSYVGSFGLSLAYLVPESAKNAVGLSQGENADNGKKDYYVDLIESKDSLLANQMKYLNELSTAEFSIGKQTDNSSDKFDDGYKLFFRTKKPTLLRSLRVKPDKSGEITVYLKDFKNKIIHKKTIFLSKAKEWNKINLNFDIERSDKYYFSYSGNMKLSYTRTDVHYDLYKNDLMELVGSALNVSDANNKSYYQYFFDLRCSLLMK